MSYDDKIRAIKNRYSVRSFSDKTISDNTISKIENILNKKHKPPFGSKTRFKLIHPYGQGTNNTEKIGTYGFIRNASYFIAGAVKKGPMYLEDYGYVFEDIILKMTELGLGTCWLGGTFNKKEFKKLMACSEDEEVPAITPLGYSIEKVSLVDRTIRAFARSDKRFDWEKLYFNENGPLDKREAGDFADALEMVRIAPSSSNNQPWRIFYDDGRFNFYIKSNVPEGSLSFRHRFKRIDIGIAMHHFEVVAEKINPGGSWVIRDGLNKEPFKKPGLTYIASWQTG